MIELREPEPPAAHTEPTFSFRGVSRKFRSPEGSPFVALSEVNLDLESSSFVCLLGPSGCGKSTLLNLGAGLLQPSSGQIFYQGHRLEGVNTGLGYMTQGDTLLPWATVRRNVLLGLDVRKIGTRADRRERVDEILDRVGLTGFAEHYPSQLSGGMRKRVGLARSLVYEPETLLMDEPFSALDAQLRLELQQHLLGLWERDRKTVVFVTHDLDEAILLADRIVLFASSPGRVVADIQVNLDRPRAHMIELRRDPRYVELSETIWTHLQEGHGR
jgi:NitT/TauT family transport system ATP-binding protein